MNDFVVMGAPVDCVGRPGGNELAPMVLRQCGVIDAIKPKLDLNDLSVRIQGEDRDPESGLKGAASVVTMTAEVRRAVAAQMAQGNKPVILGGCCSYVMGAVSAARDVIGRVGLVYIDGHLDLYDGSTSPSGECADMPLAIMLGRGPRILDESMGKHPVDAQDVSLIGYRDRYLAQPVGSLMPEDFGPEFHHHDDKAVLAIGATVIADEILEHQAKNAGKYWIHLDWDVLGEQALPSADYPMPGGLDWDTLGKLIRPLVQSSSMIGMSFACYNPDKDINRLDARRIVTSIQHMFN